MKDTFSKYILYDCWFLLTNKWLNDASAVNKLMAGVQRIIKEAIYLLLVKLPLSTQPVV